MVEKIKKNKVWFFKKINKIDKPVDRIIRKKKDTNYIGNESRDIITNRKDIKRINEVYYFF